MMPECERCTGPTMGLASHLRPICSSHDWRRSAVWQATTGRDSKQPRVVLAAPGVGASTMASPSTPALLFIWLVHPGASAW